MELGSFPTTDGKVKLWSCGFITLPFCNWREINWRSALQQKQRMTAKILYRPRSHRLPSTPLRIVCVGALIAGGFVVASHLPMDGTSMPHSQDIPGITIEGVHIGKAGKHDAVVVTSVQSNGPAHNLGIRVGDVIELVDGQPVTTRRQLSDIIASHTAPQVHFQLMRDNAPVEVNLPAPPGPSKSD